MPSENTYTCISKFGCTPAVATANPLTYSIGENVNQLMLHGSSSAVISGQYSKNSQIFMANYCANNWDGFCEIASNDNTVGYANNMDSFLGKSRMDLSQGDILVLNTARVKYLVDPGNQILMKERFDPNVVDSPYIYYYQRPDDDIESTKRGMPALADREPTYAVNPKTINDDIVMNKILSKPYLYKELLDNIFITMSRNKTINQLEGTRLGYFYKMNGFY